MWKIKISKLLSIVIRYKFWFTLFIFLIWIFLLDSNNYAYRSKQKSQIEELEIQKAYYLNKIATDSVRLFQLKTNDDILEQYAREEYLMKKPNEDLFIMVDKSGN
jgi:cell division protein FtsB